MQILERQIKGRSIEENRQKNIRVGNWVLPTRLDGNG
jgi:hypothetical protein